MIFLFSVVIYHVTCPICLVWPRKKKPSQYESWDPIHKRFSITMSIRSKFRFALDLFHMATNICTCHDSLAVMACAKYCSDYYVKISIRAKWIIHQFWIVVYKSVVRWVPWYPYGCMRSSYSTVWSTREETRSIPLTTIVTGTIIVYHMLSNVPTPYLLNHLTLVVMNI